MVISSHFVQSILVRSTLLRIVLDSLGCIHVTISSTFYTLLFVLSSLHLFLTHHWFTLTQTYHMLSFLSLTHAAPVQYIRRDFQGFVSSVFAH
ncbi:hypothetical protein C8Q74DRAFT_1241789 [Fomes fomentarius]|nr:hypothetical protein C8Q74DRAFT_1241789 [Fomes fomentarius]